MGPAALAFAAEAVESGHGGPFGPIAEEAGMADVDGSWNCTVKSPLGDQHLTLSIRGAGNRFTGEAGGAMGSMPIEGDLAGNALSWKLSVTTPMTMTLDCEATVDGDTLTGSVGAGAFGSFPLTGTRRG